MDHRFITTAFDLPGYKIAGTLGVVRGIVVRSRSAVGNFGASIQSLFGGNITILTDLCERARQDAYNQINVYGEVLQHIQSDYVEVPNIPKVTNGALRGLLHRGLKILRTRLEGLNGNGV